MWGGEGLLWAEATTQAIVARSEPSWWHSEISSPYRMGSRRKKPASSPQGSLSAGKQTAGALGDYVA